MKTCQTHGRRICIWCAATTLGFPVEHLLWERMPLLSFLSAWLGL